MYSFQIKDCHEYSKRLMRLVLTAGRDYPSDDNERVVLAHRSDFSLINEWCLHSLLFRLGIARERTKDCDFDWPQKWYYRVAYTVFGSIARIFTRK